MRLTIDKESFLKALNNASHAINPKNPVAILSNFKLELNERGLDVTGSNNEITIRSTAPYMLGDRTILGDSVFALPEDSALLFGAKTVITKMGL